MDRAHRVHQAMASRGFDGHVRVLQPGSVRAIDIVFLAGWIVFFAAARHWPLARWLGETLTGVGT
jgi:cobalt/nickel transport system permease protein